MALCLAVVVILALGLRSFTKDGQGARSTSNRLMRYRLIAQAAAVAVILLATFFGLGK